ncbi:MAG: DNA mismatch repair endonuclease MutL [Planctomycetota bacterium]
MPIRQLSQSLINKIAAGEVIERPASVVKELMENAIDAGATRVDVAVRQGGLEQMRVVDDGCGIPPEELPLAVASHATSKLAEADDLFRVGTLGFRGEALASIGEVSRLLLRSRTRGSESGAELEVVGGQVAPTVPCGCPVGTFVEVANLFFNTPVRRKFLRSTQTEFGHLSEVFTRIALAAPAAHFTLRHNDRVVFDIPPSAHWAERIAAFFGREIAGQLIAVESVDGPVRLAGYAVHPGQSRSHNRMQYFFLNRRFIRDRALQHALTEAYRGLLMTGRFPIAFLAFEMPPEMVDVNVHPTKLEVRFQDSGRIYSQLLATLRSKFLTTDLTTRVGPADPNSGPAESSASEADSARAAELRQKLVDWAKGEVAGWQRSTAGPADASGESTDEPLRLTLLPPRAAPSAELPQSNQSAEPFDSAGDVAPPGTPRASPPAGASPSQHVAIAHAAHEAPLGGHRASALQIHNRYLVTESDRGVTIIDQHALHERILYEQLRRRVESGPVETQQLLVPEPIDLRPAEAAAALEHRAVLARLGLRIEPFGGDTILLTGFPSMLASMNAAEVLRDLIDKLMTGAKQPDHRDLFDELLHTVACKAAVKAGDRLTPDEIGALLEQRHLVEDSHHCPHGRPTELVFTREELDRQFRRV